MRTILVGEVRTGRRIAQIPVSGASWSLAHRAIGGVDVDIPLGAEEFKALERTVLSGQYPNGGLFPSPSTFPVEERAAWNPGDGLRPEFLSAVEPARCFLAVAEGDQILEGGPIWPHDYDYATNALKVKSLGMKSIFDHRKVMGVITSGYAAWAVTYNAMSLGTIAKRLVQLAMSDPAGSLPIVLPADILAVDNSDHTRTYKGSELATVNDRLDQLMSVLSGPDIAFDPRFTADRMGVEWVMRVGTEVDPLLHQAGDDFAFDFRVPRGGVSGLSVHRDAGGVGSRSWATGAGSDSSLLMSRDDDTTLTDHGFPLLEVSEARSTVEAQSTLDGWAAGKLAASARPMMTLSASIRADMSPLLGSYRPGDWVKLWAPKTHPYLSMIWPAGYQRARILNFSGDLTNDVKITFAPMMGAR